MRARKPVLIAAVSLSLAVLGTTQALGAGPQSAADSKIDPRRDFGDTSGLPPAPPAMAAGVIVKTRSGADLGAVRSEVAQALDAPESAGVAVARRTRAYAGAEMVPQAQAQRIADDLSAEPGVAWAVPNTVRYAADTAWPVPVNDAYWTNLHNIWDTRTAENLDVVNSGSTPWPNGGYGTKAPALWPATQGGGVVVAVLDTGIRENHPDLAPNLVSGFDMISANPGTSFVSANDGDGRDANPSDPGDWATSSLCYTGQPARDSSWHGSHVAGTIAAVGNNAQGVVGVAPQAKIQPIRVLGRCGGTDADIAAGIMWAAGLPVPGLPPNPTPAKILNLSLGGQGTCAQPTIDAINAARSVGASIVVALGNSSADAVNYTPANCPGVIGVHSTTPYGDHAEYSNFGTPADVSAPGGDSSWGSTQAILSTVDQGTTTPTAPTYAFKQGTSMATPAAAGVAALLAALGPFNPDQMEAALKASVTGFPTSGKTYFIPCNTNQCGTGIVDSTKIPAPVGAPSISGTPLPGSVLAATDVGWIGPAQGHVFTWYLNNVAVANGTAFTVPPGTGGAAVSVRVSVAGGVFAPIGATSAPVIIQAPPAPPPKKASKVKVKAPKTVRAGARPKLRITVKVVGVKKPTGKIKIFDGKRKVKTIKLKAKKKGKITFKMPRLRKAVHKMKVVYSGNKKIKSSRKKFKIRAR